LTVMFGCLMLAGCPKEPCDASSCTGCCDATGECLAGTQIATCGTRGAQCVACRAVQQCVKQQCIGDEPDGGVDGGTVEPDGGVIIGCLPGLCGAQVCDVASGQCTSPSPCDVLAPQPGSCSPGQFCGATNLCTDAPRPTCANFSNQSLPRKWTPASPIGQGPMIWAARQLSFSVDDAGCPSGSTRRGVVALEVSDRQARLGGDGGLPRLLTYRENATLGEVRANEFKEVRASANGSVATVEVVICTAQTVTRLTVGYAFEGGNGVCVLLTSP
jgi:hypothetical protein